MTDLSIVILNYNTRGLTINCLNSIVDQYKNDLEKGIFEIILVDNASVDDSVNQITKLKSKIPNLKIVESKENLGFSKGCDLGARNASGDHLLFLNSDTEIKDQGFLKMVDFLKKNEKIAILGGKLKNADGTSQPSAGKFYNLFYLFLLLLGMERLGLMKKSPDKIEKVDWVSGACLMIKRKVYEKIGGFNKEIFMYAEDMEICFKAIKKGFQTYFYPEITLFHKGEGSSNRAFAIINIYKGILIFYKNNMSGWQYAFAKLMLFSKALILKTIGEILHNKYYAQTYGQALELFKR